jgi:hypothetical protein
MDDRSHLGNCLACHTEVLDEERPGNCLPIGEEESIWRRVNGCQSPSGCIGAEKKLHRVQSKVMLGRRSRQFPRFTQELCGDSWIYILISNIVCVNRQVNSGFNTYIIALQRVYDPPPVLCFPSIESSTHRLTVLVLMFSLVPPEQPYM